MPAKTFEQMKQETFEVPVKAQQALVFLAPLTVDLPQNLTDASGVLQAMPTGFFPAGVLEKKGGLKFSTEIATAADEGYNYGAPVREDITGAPTEVTMTLFKSFKKNVTEAIYISDKGWGAINGAWEGLSTGDLQNGFTLAFYLSDPPNSSKGWEIRIRDRASGTRCWGVACKTGTNLGSTVSPIMRAGTGSSSVQLAYEPGTWYLTLNPQGILTLQAPSGLKVDVDASGLGPWQTPQGEVPRLGPAEWLPSGGRPGVSFNRLGAITDNEGPSIGSIILTDGGRAGWVPRWTYQPTEIPGPPFGVPKIPGPVIDRGWSAGPEGGFPDLNLPARDKWPRVFAIPGFDGLTTLDVLSKVSEALVWPMWTDEYGTVIMMTVPYFGSGPARVVQAKTSVADLSWSESLTALKSRTTLKYREGKVQHDDHARIRLWQPNSLIQVGSGRPYSETITPPNEETDWAGIPEGAIYDFGRLTAAQQGDPTGNWIGGSQPDGTALPVGSVLGTVTKVSGRKWLIEITCPSQRGPIAVVMPASQATAQGKQWANANAPVLRGTDLITWQDKQVDAVTNGVIGAVYSHDAGWALQKITDAQALAAWIQNRLSAGGGAVVESIDLIPDPRIQIGDRLRVEDDSRSGAWVEGVVVGTSITVSAGQIDQSVKLRVFSAGEV